MFLLPNVLGSQVLTGIGGTNTTVNSNGAVSSQPKDLGKHSTGGDKYGQIFLSLNASKSSAVYKSTSKIHVRSYQALIIIKA